MLTIICLSHAEHVANRATRRVSDDDHPVLQEAVADDSALSVVFSRVFNLDRRTFKDGQCVFEVEAALSESLLSLGWIKGEAHPDSVSTITGQSKARVEMRLLRRLTFELRRGQRQDARPGPVKMYRVPPARDWWLAVGPRLERGVRHQMATRCASAS